MQPGFINPEVMSLGISGFRGTPKPQHRPRSVVELWGRCRPLQRWLSPLGADGARRGRSSPGGPNTSMRNLPQIREGPETPPSRLQAGGCPGKFCCAPQSGSPSPEERAPQNWGIEQMQMIRILIVIKISYTVYWNRPWENGRFIVALLRKVTDCWQLNAQHLIKSTL